MINFWHLIILLQLIVVLIGLMFKDFFNYVDYKVMIITGIFMQISICIGFLLADIF